MYVHTNTNICTFMRINHNDPLELPFLLLSQSLILTIECRIKHLFNADTKSLELPFLCVRVGCVAVI